MTEVNKNGAPPRFEGYLIQRIWISFKIRDARFAVYHNAMPFLVNLKKKKK
jgi:hypothetical protein